MVTAVLKMYFIGTALTVLAILVGLVDSFGGLMYPQNRHYDVGLDHHSKTQRRDDSSDRHRGASVCKCIGIPAL